MACMEDIKSIVVKKESKNFLARSQDAGLILIPIDLISSTFPDTKSPLHLGDWLLLNIKEIPEKEISEKKNKEKQVLYSFQATDIQRHIPPFPCGQVGPDKKNYDSVEIQQVPAMVTTCYSKHGFLWSEKLGRIYMDNKITDNFRAHSPPRTIVSCNMQSVVEADKDYGWSATLIHEQLNGDIPFPSIQKCNTEILWTTIRYGYLQDHKLGEIFFSHNDLCEEWNTIPPSMKQKKNYNALVVPFFHYRTKWRAVLVEPVDDNITGHDSSTISVHSEVDRGLSAAMARCSVTDSEQPEGEKVNVKLESITFGIDNCFSEQQPESYLFPANIPDLNISSSQHAHQGDKPENGHDEQLQNMQPSQIDINDTGPKKGSFESPLEKSSLKWGHCSSVDLIQWLNQSFSLETEKQGTHYGETEKKGSKPGSLSSSEADSTKPKDLLIVNDQSKNVTFLQQQEAVVSKCIVNGDSSPTFDARKPIGNFPSMNMITSSATHTKTSPMHKSHSAYEPLFHSESDGSKVGANFRDLSRVTFGNRKEYPCKTAAEKGNMFESTENSTEIIRKQSEVALERIQNGTSVISTACNTKQKQTDGDGQNIHSVVTKTSQNTDIVQGDFSSDIAHTLSPNPVCEQEEENQPVRTLEEAHLKIAQLQRELLCANVQVNIFKAEAECYKREAANTDLMLEAANRRIFELKQKQNIMDKTFFTQLAHLKMQLCHQSESDKSFNEMFAEVQEEQMENPAKICYLCSENEKLRAEVAETRCHQSQQCHLNSTTVDFEPFSTSVGYDRQLAKTSSSISAFQQSVFAPDAAESARNINIMASRYVAPSAGPNKAQLLVSEANGNSVLACKKKSKTRRRTKKRQKTLMPPTILLQGPTHQGGSGIGHLKGSLQTEKDSNSATGFGKKSRRKKKNPKSQATAQPTVQFNLMGKSMQHGANVAVSPVQAMPCQKVPDAEKGSCSVSGVLKGGTKRNKSRNKSKSKNKI